MTPHQLILVLILVVLAAVLLMLFLPGLWRRPAPRPTTSDYRDDDRFWILGFLYNNPDDPTVFVPKRFVPGRTINVGQPMGKLIMGGLLLLVVLLAILASSGALPAYGCHPSGCNL